MDLRAMQSIYNFPTLVIFAAGKGIATAKALIEAASDAATLNLDFRQTVRLYYRVHFLIHVQHLRLSMCLLTCNLNGGLSVSAFNVFKSRFRLQ